MASPSDLARIPDDNQNPIADQSVSAGDASHRGWRLTVYFALLVGAVALAAAAATVYVFVQTDRDSRRTAESNARFAARTAAKQLGDGIATLKTTVASLAAAPNIEQAAAQPACTLTFDLGDLSRGHIDVLQPDGSVACSSRPREDGGKALAGYEGADWLARIGKKPTFLAPVVDAATNDRSAVVAMRSPGNAIIAAFVALEPVGPGLVSLYGGGDPVEFLVTSHDERRVLSRSIDPGRWIGAALSGTAFSRGAGEVERRDVDGTPRLYEQAVVPGVGWHFYAGEDKAAALAAGDSLRKRQLAIILAGLALVLLATFAVYRRVAVPIRRLGARVRLTTSLIPPEPVPVAGPAEVTDLGTDINGLIQSAGDELRRRERAEEITRASERSYRLLFENSPLPMWIHDVETNAMLAVNDAAVARYGYTREEFLRLTAADLAVPGEDPVPHEVDGQLESSRHLRKDGREIKARIIAHSVIFDGRDACCVVAEDVGERERLENQLRQAQKMEAVGQLAGGVAHDFNNLLTVIAGYSGMARNRIGLGPGVRELTEIDRAAERAAQLTHQLLTFSRQQVLAPVVLDLNEVVDVVTPMLSRLIGEDIEIGVLAGKDTPPLIADRGQIEQVIVNLAVNARDAMPDGGTLTISTRGVNIDERYAADHAGIEPGHYACLSVTDTGVGIDQETQARIFEPFFTTKEVGEGTGLGLATVHGIVEQSGGHLEVYSELGLGSSFKVYMPAAVGEAVTSADSQPESAETLTGTETVLVCEDDELVRILLQTILTENGYRVLSASKPDEALSLAAAHGADIDVLVTDVIMPQLSGPELVERLEETRPGLPVLLLSGYPAETIRNRPLPAGSLFLQKPFDELSLLGRIRTLLDQEPETVPADVRPHRLGA